MKLFSKIPRRVRVRDRDDKTNQPDYQKEYHLEPNEGVEVPDITAERILKRDSHIVSKTPLDAVTKQNSAEKYRKLLLALEKVDIEGLTNNELYEWGAKLDSSMTKRMPNKVRLQVLGKRVDELVDQLAEVEDDFSGTGPVEVVNELEEAKSGLTLTQSALKETQSANRKLQQKLEKIEKEKSEQDRATAAQVTRDPGDTESVEV